MKRLVVYLAVTFGLAWGLLIPAGFALKTFEAGAESSALMVALIALSMFFPLAGALAANCACRPDERIDLACRPRIRGNALPYLIAWLLPAALALAGCVVFFAANPQWFDPAMQSFLQTIAAADGLDGGRPAEELPSAPAMAAAVLASAVLIAPFINAIPAFGEELGWRGMLFPTLAEHMSPRAASLLTGAIWGLWHAPVIAMGHNYGMGYAGFPFAGILVMTVMCTAMGCFLARLRMRSESVWPCALAHGSFNAAANVGLMVCTCGQTLYGPSPLGLVAGIPLVVLGAICWRRLPNARP